MKLTMNNSWSNLLQKEFEKDYFRQLTDFVSKEYTEKKGSIFPPSDFIFQAYNECPLDQLKVVIVGQDPYPTLGHAHGLCFSIEENIRPFPKSLKNIFRELESDVFAPFPENGNLNRWARQGVLLLNTVLTVEEGKPDAHSKRGWEQFTSATIEAIQKTKTEIVYLLWGAKAQEKASQVNPMENFVLKTAHPSPLSAYRGFFGSKPFSRTNAYLTEKGKLPINW
jgi:uracil-DNA glycosylase